MLIGVVKILNIIHVPLKSTLKIIMKINFFLLIYLFLLL